MSKSSSSNDKIIYTKVENAYAVWFKASRIFLMIEEPAFYILKLFLKNTPQDEISHKFSIRYNTPIADVKNFVLEINQTFGQHLIPFEKESLSASDLSYTQFQCKKFYSEKTYSFNNLLIKISYGDRELEDVIHPLVAHFKFDKQSSPNHLFEIFRHSDKLFFKANGNFVEELKINETGYLKAAVLLRLLSILHEVKHEHWMMTIHAAAVTDGSSAVVFPAMAGSGKSTLAALLHAHGFNMLSDDFLAMDVINKSIYQLPVAATIKDGSFDVLSPYFPELNDISLEKAYTGKEVRYLPINNSLNTKVGFMAKKFVFITYCAGEPLKFEMVSKKIALQALLHETWINPIPSVVTEFFDWFNKTQFFELKYSKTSDALKIVKGLFKE